MLRAQECIVMAQMLGLVSLGDWEVGGGEEKVHKHVEIETWII